MEKKINQNNLLLSNSKLRLVIVLLAFLFTTHQHLFAQGTQKKEPQRLTRILLIFDFSNSMYGLWETDSKINVAKKLVAQLVDSLSPMPNVELALRCYGHQKNFPPQDCDDTKLEVPFAYNNGMAIKSKINKLVPKGTTPIALSLEACAKDFPDNKSKNVVLLITDGKEECGGDPCAISAALQSKNIVLKPFIIGIGVLDESIKQSFNCMGNYYDAAGEKNFKQVLNIVITQALNATTCQVNLIDKNGKPTETDAALSFYDQQTGALKYTFVHTMNNRGIPDTLRLEASGIYRVVAHTLPSVEVKDVKLIAGKHNIIPMDAPQGFLKVKTGENNLHRDIGFILRKKNESQTLVAATLKDQLKLIVGEYELEILTLPRTYVKNVTISQSHTTQVKIDEPGSVNFQLSSFGTASILIQKEKEWIWVTNLSDNQTQETLKLMPGAYKLVFRAKSAKETLFTTEKNFTVTAGESQIVSLK